MTIAGVKLNYILEKPVARLKRRCKKLQTIYFEKLWMSKTKAILLFVTLDEFLSLLLLLTKKTDLLSCCRNDDDIFGKKWQSNLDNVSRKEKWGMRLIRAFFWLKIPWTDRLAIFVIITLQKMLT